MTIGRVWRNAMQGERMSHSASYGGGEQRRSVPARCDSSVTVIYERLLRLMSECLTPWHYSQSQAIMIGFQLTPSRHIYALS
ncbi:hypothetical protein [Nitrosomonas sp.]|uniref:hypothetical protein n=1 Tax=Nitrosomonas sp. TaxID=42353 RepID=UPI0025E24705|nr:hypothetical protein [Nitrosomonas sp.]